ncbi:MAG TPA: S-formylglutathione hydrolase [Polyangiaceae bacterium]|nr:S-formylglutathione hydrolase [Polyangiaceae bacterium]
MERVSRSRCFGGHQDVYEHDSPTLGCQMRFAVYLPSRSQREPCPVLYFLSGLTCSEQNAITKAGAQRHCEDHGIVLVCPDTSPRGPGVPDDPADDLGQGAGFYLNATQLPWSRNYRMFDYLTAELPQLVQGNFPVTEARGICGHSMGGNGALVLALSRPDLFRSVSALAPIASPMHCPWGEKAFKAYLGEDREAWRRYDACELVASHAGPAIAVLVDQGTDDGFLTKQLKPELLEAAAKGSRVSLELRRQPGYDHGYYFISTFIGDHVAHHARMLRG